MREDFIDAINRIVKIWAQISNNVRIRDRTVKAIQYGCQMCIGYYGDRLKEDLMNSLRITRKTASTSRKAFWLFKSINHMVTFIDLLQDLQHAFTITKGLDLLEQFFLIIYYFFENIIFLIRVSVFTHITETDVEDYVNWSNFWGDLAGFLSSMIHFLHKFFSWREVKGRLGQGNLLLNEEVGGGGGGSGMNPKKEAAILGREVFDSSIALIISGMELVTSIDFVHLWRKIIGRDIGDGPVGFCGFASSLIIIADAINKTFRRSI